ncbi:hypothetical protein Gotri_026520 [Gossypium trilobum]|uniref:Uncharacterized protein n=1 Tax=Gossypium trilobum TaxID=34281 RepID=A0A7J9FPN7_9ROSI|nr:hypothetical protein [Gossypium trilobum]
MELKARFGKIEEMKERIEELEMALRNCEIRIENRDHIMGEAVVQIREVADHLQTLTM